MNLTTPRPSRYSARLLKFYSGHPLPLALAVFLCPFAGAHLCVWQSYRGKCCFMAIADVVDKPKYPIWLAVSIETESESSPLLSPYSSVLLKTGDFKSIWSLAMLNLNSQNTRLPNLAKPLFALGAVMTCLSLIVQARVYASFGESFEAVLYVFFGLTLAICTITLPSLSVIFWYSNKVLIALLLGFLALACLGLSFVSHVGFSALANANAETTRGAALSADLADQITATRKQIDAVDQRLAACPAGYRANCLEPLQAEKSPLLAKLNALETQKLDHAPTAEHPLFLALDKLRAGNSSSKELFMAGSSLIFEVLAGLILMVAGYFKSQEATDAPVFTQAPTPISTPQTPPRTALGTDGQAVNVGGNYSVKFNAHANANKAAPQPRTPAQDQAQGIDNTNDTGVRNVQHQSAQELETGQCLQCGDEYPLTRFERKFCTAKCKSDHYNEKRRTPAQSAQTFH